MTKEKTAKRGIGHYEELNQYDYDPTLFNIGEHLS